MAMKTESSAQEMAARRKEVDHLQAGALILVARARNLALHHSLPNDEQT
jgi:hypothetical protein